MIGEIRTVTFGDHDALGAFLLTHHRELEESPLLSPPPVHVDLFTDAGAVLRSSVVIGAWDGPDLVGFARVTLPDHPALMHRAELGAGVLASHRGHGIGRKVIAEAVKLAAIFERIRWLDGIAIETNRTVLRIDMEAGFQIRGCIDDFVRVEGRSIALYQMTLDLDRYRAERRGEE